MRKDLQNKAQALMDEYRISAYEEFVVDIIKMLPPKSRLKVIEKFCSRCAETKCPDKYDCHPRD